MPMWVREAFRWEGADSKGVVFTSHLVSALNGSMTCCGRPCSIAETFAREAPPPNLCPSCSRTYVAMRRNERAMAD